MEIRIIESTRPSREFLKNHTAYPLRWQSCALNLATLISARTRTTADSDDFRRFTLDLRLPELRAPHEIGPEGARMIDPRKIERSTKTAIL